MEMTCIMQKQNMYTQLQDFKPFAFLKITNLYMFCTSLVLTFEYTSTAIYFLEMKKCVTAHNFLYKIRTKCVTPLIYRGKACMPRFLMKA